MNRLINDFVSFLQKTNGAKMLVALGLAAILIFCAASFASYVLFKINDWRVDKKIERLEHSANSSIREADDAAADKNRAEGAANRATQQILREENNLDDAKFNTNSSLDAVNRVRSGNYAGSDRANTRRKLDELYPDQKRE